MTLTRNGNVLSNIASSPLEGPSPGPLSDKTEKAKVNYLMTYIGDKGREVYGTFEFAPAAAEGQAAEHDTLAGVYAKFAEYVAPKT